jgi:hypothetical protein
MSSCPTAPVTQRIAYLELFYRDLAKGKSNRSFFEILDKQDQKVVLQALKKSREDGLTGNDVVLRVQTAVRSRIKLLETRGEKDLSAMSAANHSERTIQDLPMMPILQRVFAFAGGDMTTMAATSKRFQTVQKGRAKELLIKLADDPEIQKLTTGAFKKDIIAKMPEDAAWKLLQVLYKNILGTLDKLDPSFAKGVKNRQKMISGRKIELSLDGLEKTITQLLNRIKKIHEHDLICFFNGVVSYLPKDQRPPDDFIKNNKDCINGAITTWMEANFHALSQIEQLWISDAKLKTIPDQIKYLTGLRMLNLSHNEIGIITPQIGKLRRLTTLILAHNKIQTIPPEMCELHELRNIFLQENLITIVPPHFLESFPHLKAINLRGNPIISESKLTKPGSGTDG